MANHAIVRVDVALGNNAMSAVKSAMYYTTYTVSTKTEGAIDNANIVELKDAIFFITDKDANIYLSDGNIISGNKKDYDHLTFENETPIKQDFDDLTNDVVEWHVGDIVIHKKLGRGVVVALEGDDIIKVNFDEHGEKSILGTHPSVSKGGHKA